MKNVMPDRITAPISEDAITGQLVRLFQLCDRERVALPSPSICAIIINYGEHTKHTLDAPPFHQPRRDEG